MHLYRRYEVHDFRNRERRQDNLNSSPSSSVWGNVKKVINFLEKPVVIGLFIYHLYVIGGWLSDWYAKRRAAKYGYQKRDYIGHWNVKELKGVEYIPGCASMPREG